MKSLLVLLLVCVSACASQTVPEFAEETRTYDVTNNEELVPDYVDYETTTTAEIEEFVTNDVAQQAIVDVEVVATLPGIDDTTRQVTRAIINVLNTTRKPTIEEYTSPVTSDDVTHGELPDSTQQPRVLEMGEACACDAECPDIYELTTMMNFQSSACRLCVSTECAQANRSELASCIFQARMDCVGCPTMASQEQTAMRSCKSCKKRCSRMPRPTRRDHLRQSFTNRSCRRSCRSPIQCPSRSQIMNRLNRTSDECKQCMTNECGPYNRMNRSEVISCMYRARRDCMSCPTLNLSEQIRFKRCQICVVQSRCATVTAESSCGRSCQLRKVCPTTQQIIATIRSDRQSCQDCVMERCGSYSMPNRSDVASCMYKVRSNCSECTISPGARMYRRYCKTCMDRCLGDDEEEDTASPTATSYSNLMRNYIPYYGSGHSWTFYLRYLANLHRGTYNPATRNPNNRYYPTQRPTPRYYPTQRPTPRYYPTQRPTPRYYPTQRPTPRYYPTQRPTPRYYPTQRPTPRYYPTQRPTPRYYPTQRPTPRYYPTQRPTPRYYPTQRSTTRYPYSGHYYQPHRYGNQPHGSQSSSNNQGQYHYRPTTTRPTTTTRSPPQGGYPGSSYSPYRPNYGSQSQNQGSSNQGSYNRRPSYQGSYQVFRT